jgi:hypothetical protein
MLTVVTPPRHTNLTTLQRARVELQKCIGVEDDWILQAIEDASRAVMEELDRPLLRSRVSQRFSGNGDTTAMLDLTPVASLESVEGSSWIGGLLDLTTGQVRITDALAGFLWREQGWPDDTPWGLDITADRSAYQGVMPWTATYLGGYLVADDDFAANGVVVAENGTFTMPVGVPPPLLAAGDVVKLSGFVGAKNVGRFVVVSASDTGFVLAGTFTAETAVNGSRVEVRTLPASIERAVFDTLHSWWNRRGRDQSVTSERIGDWSATYSNKGTADMTLPESATKGLAKFKRSA